MPKKKRNKKAIEPLPRCIHGELRMAYAMRGHLDLKSGKPRLLNDQHTRIARFFHGSPPNYPSQIKLLAEGRASYQDLFEEETVKNAKKGRCRRSEGSSVKKCFLCSGWEGVP